MSSTEPNKTFLEFLPVSLFGSIMGLSGLSFAWKLAGKAWGYPTWPGNFVGMLAISFFLILSGAYIVKWFRYPSTVKAEFNHPVSVSFFTTFIVSLLLIPGIILPYSTNLAVGVWIIGAVLVFVFAFVRLRTMFFTTQEPSNALPSWLLPIVGIIDVPIVGYSLPLPGIHEICVVYFGIGVVLTLIFIPICLLLSILRYTFYFSDIWHEGAIDSKMLPFQSRLVGRWLSAGRNDYCVFQICQPQTFILL